MNDQIKDFVDKNREEFDHLEAPAFDMQRFKKNVLPQPKPVEKVVPLFKKTKWLVAAAVLITIGMAYVIFLQQHREKQLTAGVTKKDINKVELKVAEKVDSSKNTETVVAKNTPHVLLQTENPQKREKANPNVKVEVNSGLNDSTSASRRLLAILEIEKSKSIDAKTMDMLSKTLNQDGNTNVRLAALSVLQKYSTDSHASSLLVNALGKQDDPIVQLGLINMLGKMKHVKIEDKLHAIVENPQTFAAVRDEAYNILLNQDKL